MGGVFGRIRYRLAGKRSYHDWRFASVARYCYRVGADSRYCIAIKLQEISQAGRIGYIILYENKEKKEKATCERGGG